MTNELLKTFAPEIRKRMKTERAIIRRLVMDALYAGYVIDVDDGGDELALEDARTVRPVLEAMQNTDEDTMILRRGKEKGWVKFIYDNGNDGLYVISDYSTNMDAIVDGAMKLSERLEQEANR